MWGTGIREVLPVFTYLILILDDVGLSKQKLLYAPLSVLFPVGLILWKEEEVLSVTGHIQ